MPYLVDGSNLIGFLPGYALSDPRDRTRLLTILLRVPEVRRRGLVLVHDGSPPQGKRRQRLAPDVDVRWSGSRTDADTIIRHLMDKAHSNHYILVTDDRELRDYANLHGFRSIPCIEMARMLPSERDEEEPPAEDPPEKTSPPRLSEDDVQEWLEWFGEDDEEG